MGIEDEYASFYRAEYSHVVRTSYLVVHDPQRAEDVAQEAFIQLFTHWRKVSRYEQPGAWVKTPGGAETNGSILDSTWVLRQTY